MKTFSYVVDHDHGYAPNPQRGLCTLVHCKFQGSAPKRNIVELADVPDIIIGTGGDGKCTTGNGTIIYIMQVTQKIPFTDYLVQKGFRGRVDNHDNGTGNKFALISNKFIYFGKNAIEINTLPKKYQNIEKKGPWFKYLMPPNIGSDLYTYLEKHYGSGMKGSPVCNDFNICPSIRC